jgi:hypothetical protein
VYYFLQICILFWPPLWFSGRSSCLQIQRYRARFSEAPDFSEEYLERGPPSLVSTIEELLGWKGSGSGLECRKYGRRDPPRWPRDILYLKELALTSPTRGGRSFGIVRSRIKATDFSLLYSVLHFLQTQSRNFMDRGLEMYIWGFGIIKELIYEELTCSDTCSAGRDISGRNAAGMLMSVSEWEAMIIRSGDIAPTGVSIGSPIFLGRCPSLSAHESESMLRTYLVCREKQANGTWEKHTVY